MCNRYCCLATSKLSWKSSLALLTRSWESRYLSPHFVAQSGYVTQAGLQELSRSLWRMVSEKAFMLLMRRCPQAWGSYPICSRQWTQNRAGVPGASLSRRPKAAPLLIWLSHYQLGTSKSIFLTHTKGKGNTTFPTLPWLSIDFSELQFSNWQRLEWHLHLWWWDVIGNIFHLFSLQIFLFCQIFPKLPGISFNNYMYKT